MLRLPSRVRPPGSARSPHNYTDAGNTVEADVAFDDAGDLVGFLWHNHTQEDAKGSHNIPWSTPISGYREVNGIRVGAHGNANWIDQSGEWTYGKFEIRSIAYNVTR